MARSGKKNKQAVSFEFPVSVEVTIPEFEPSASLALLDISLLSKGNHTIDLGFVKGGCCRKQARAIVRKGMVTKIELESCGDEAKPSPEMERIFTEARRQIMGEQDPKWKPVPVAEFIGKGRAVNIHSPCFTICILGFCFMCCQLGGVPGCFPVDRKGNPR